MGPFLFIGLLFLLPAGLGLLFYFVPKRLGFPVAAKYLTMVYGIVVVTIGLFITCSDSLFTKNNAKKLVEEQDIQLTDGFELLKNESISAIGDYYHTFTLIISERDKQCAVHTIISDEKFETNGASIEQLMYQPGPDRYFGEKVIQNYETDNSFVREYFEPSGREGYAPKFIRISISKSDNQLTFEDITE